jgi:FMN-dependent oxidoreductase (nitrilotriacetate monooxygenase family)
MTPQPFHLAWFQSGSSQHWSWESPRPGDAKTNWMNPKLLIDLAQSLERAGFDYVLLEDNTYVPDAYGDSMDFYLRNALSVPRFDPNIISPILAAATSRIGIVPTISTFAYHPYLVARQVGTLDQVSGGRAGWNMVTGSSDRAVQNYGLTEMEEHDQRYEMADEFLQVTNGLFDCWEPGAIVADRDAGMWADPSKVHHLDFQGQWYSSRGPLNSGPAPQGHPVLAQAGSSPRGREFAAKWADTIVGSERSVAGMKSFRDDVRERMVRMGRKPDDCKILYTMSPTIGASSAEAQERKEQRRLAAWDNAEIQLAVLSKMTSINFGQFPLDEPLSADGLTTNGTQATLSDFLDRNQGRTLREASVATAQRSEEGLDFTGTADEVAGKMAEVMEEVGGDGFLIGSGSLSRRYIAEITEELVPALQKRGLVRSSYTYEQLRDNLLEF